MNYDREYRLKRKNKGLCVTCGKPRGRDGTAELCRQHADEASLRQKKYNARLVSKGLCTRCYQPMGTGGTKLLCLVCADTVRKQRMVRYWKNKEQK
jgi:hypothetical protein